MATPLISVVMPVFNTARYLEAAVRSIREQSFSDFEFLIYDDGSTDCSREILARHAGEDARINLTFGEHRGYCHWLVAGVAAARGPLLARMDSDDISHRDRFTRQVEFLRVYPECAAVGATPVAIDEDGDVLFTYQATLEPAQIVSALLACRGSMLCHPSVMMRTNLVRMVGGYRPEFECTEDVDLFLRLAEVGELRNVPECLLWYRLHAKSVSNARRQQQCLNTLGIYREACGRRGIPVPEIVTEGVARGGTVMTSDDLRRGIIWRTLQEGRRGVARKHLRRLDERKWSDRWLWLEAWLGSQATTILKRAYAKLRPDKRSLSKPVIPT